MSVLKIIGQITPDKLPNASFENSLPSILRVVFVSAALLSVIFVAIGGLKYTLSSGDPQGAAKAKNTILYALIGLVVAVMAFTIVSFVGGRLV
jgi:hypothetical protein